MVEPADHVEVLETGQVLVDGRVLTGDADHGPDALGPRQHVDPVDRRGALIRLDQRGEHLDRGGLARAVRAEKRLHRSLRNLQVEAVERVNGFRTAGRYVFFRPHASMYGTHGNVPQMDRSPSESYGHE